MPETETKNHFKLVNLWQTNEERYGKYWLCRSLNATPAMAQRMRDWRLSKIERLFNLDTTNKQKPELERTIDHQKVIKAIV